MTALSRRALFARPITPPPRPPVAAIGPACLAEQGSYCRTCGEACGEGAIRFHLLPRGRARAEVLADRCTACGDCLPACPSQAITLPAAEGVSA